MAKPLKVTHAVCPCCHFRKPLEDSGHYVRHFLLGCKLPSGEIVNCICDGSGMKASRVALRQERKRLRDVDAIERRHAEMLRMRKELAAEAQKLQSDQGINADVVCSLLKAYDLWLPIPPRRKFTICKMLKRLYSEGANLIVEMFSGKPANIGLQNIARSLIKKIQREQSTF